MERPTCSGCRYFYMTYDTHAPRGCKLFKFASQNYPSQVVERESGQACHGFKAKGQAQDKEAKKMDLNDPKYW